MFEKTHPEISKVAKLIDNDTFEEVMLPSLNHFYDEDTEEWQVEYMNPLTGKQESTIGYKFSDFLEVKISRELAKAKGLILNQMADSNYETWPYFATARIAQCELIRKKVQKEPQLKKYSSILDCMSNLKRYIETDCDTHSGKKKGTPSRADHKVIICKLKDRDLDNAITNLVAVLEENGFIKKKPGTRVSFENLLKGHPCETQIDWIGTIMELRTFVYILGKTETVKIPHYGKYQITVKSFTYHNSKIRTVQLKGTKNSSDSGSILLLEKAVAQFSPNSPIKTRQ